MIQDIAPHTYDPVFRRKKPEDRDYLLHYEYNKVMLNQKRKGECDSHLRGTGGGRRFFGTGRVPVFH